ALHTGTAVNAINFDAHTDFRAREGRHSGHGFSYAYEEKFLDKYFIFGLHENYTSKSIFQEIKNTNGDVAYNTFEEIAIREEKPFSIQLNIAHQHIKDKRYGIEMDLDSIEMIPSSAITPTGFTATDARRFILYTSKSIFQEIKNTNGDVAYNTFEEIAIREEKPFSIQLNIAHQHIKDKRYGIEMDLDSIEMIPSSAITPTGFTATDARRFIHY